jgi:hypothetical protein
LIAPLSVHSVDLLALERFDEWTVASGHHWPGRRSGPHMSEKLDLSWYFVTRSGVRERGLTGGGTGFVTCRAPKVTTFGQK